MESGLVKANNNQAPKERPLEGPLRKSFLGHLEDLRFVLLKSLGSVAIGLVVSFAFISKIFHFILLPYQKLISEVGAGLINAPLLIKSLGPSETFTISIKLAFWLGAILASPVIIYQAWKFISPALLLKERRSLKFVLSMGPLFFLAGVIFSYYLVLPLGLRFLWNYSLQMGVYPDWTITHYINFALMFFFAFGIAFELPVALVVLAKLGIVNAAMLSSRRRHAIVIIFIVAGILTPPDVASQVLLGVPMIVLYEVSILMVRLVGKGAL